MWIERKNSKGKTLFVFCFSSVEHDFRPYIDGLKDVAELVGEDEEKYLMEIISKLESRTDDKYANDEVAVSGMLFADEMASFTCDLSMSALALSWRLESCEKSLDAFNETCERYKNICDE